MSIDWHQLEKCGIIPDKTANDLSIFSSMQVSSLKDILESRSIEESIISCLKRATADETANVFILGRLVELCRQDSSLWSRFAVIPEIESTLERCILRSSVPSFLEKAGMLYSGILSHSSESWNINKVVISRISEKLEGLPLLNVMTQLLKSSRFRSTVASDIRFRNALTAGLEGKSEETLYRSLFCLWLASSDVSIFRSFVSYERMLTVLKSIMNDVRSEKITRMTLLVLKPTLENNIISDDIAQGWFLDYLERWSLEKWKDDDIPQLLNEIRVLFDALSLRINSIESMAAAVRSGKLSRGRLHSEDFWRSNAKEVEANHFDIIIGLIGMVLHCTDSETLALACFNIGEFTKHSAVSRKSPHILEMKPHIIALMTHPSRDVAREALLCTQKLMLNTIATA
jgi:V-type H+-transporting ATPase subunit H